jgi:hypothetical protein
MQNNTANLIDKIFGELEIKHDLNVFTILTQDFPKNRLSRSGPNDCCGSKLCF